MATPSIALASLEIRNFRGIESLDLDFRGPDGRPNQLVVLAGPNGSGKTAVLEAALLAADKSTALTGPADKRAVRRGADGYSIQAVFESRGQAETVVVGVPGPRAPRTYEARPVSYFSSWRAPKLIGPVDPRVGKPGRPPAKTERNRLWMVKQSLVTAAAIERFENPPPFFGRYSSMIQEINDAWREFHPEQAQPFSVRIADSEGSNTGSFDVFFQLDEGRWLEVDQLSAGQLELFLLIGSLVLDGEREGLLVIDEPELHLDPQWHRPILRCLLKLQPRVQVLVATHSPEIYDGARSYERHFLVPEDDPRARAWHRIHPVVAGV